MKNVLKTLLLSGLTCGQVAFGSKKLIVVEQENGTVSSYETKTGRLLGTVKVELNPHEVTLNSDGTVAYVTNFGVQDYDHNIGTPGVSVVLPGFQHKN
ncbi:MAG: hypothetical protein COT74_02035 [Bdellovibrionales bacterium CG10_big_fil_rev_8_21_14_0_10_45_34]|nr:MAG: hypothetical protein COT74_02035 [Bdellovibrionales bacterium CG10_big_fil_rev_8_21_14_0_10_45_34]